MTITIRLTKVEVEMLKEFQKKKDKRGLEEKVRLDLSSHNKVSCAIISEQIHCENAL